MVEDPLVLDVPVPDSLDVVVGLAEMIATCAAEQLQRTDALRLSHLAHADVAGRRFTDVVMRGLRVGILLSRRYVR